MKNKYLNLKNALISATVAVFTGVLLLGVTVALGEAPTYDPPGAGVSPTFSGLTVEGDATIGTLDNPSSGSGDLVIRGSIKNDVSPSSVEVDDNLKVTGNASIDGGASVGGDLNITGNIGNVDKIYTSFQPGKGDILVGGALKSNKLGGEPLLIDDDLDVNGDLWLLNDGWIYLDQGSISAQQMIAGGEIQGGQAYLPFIKSSQGDPDLDPVSIQDDLEITNDLKVDEIKYYGLNPDNAIHILNNLNLYGNNLLSDNFIGGVEAVKISDPEGVDITGPIINSTGDVKIADTINLEGKLWNANNAVNNGWVFIDDVLQVSNRAIFQTGGVEANAGLTVSGSPLVVNSELQAKGDLKVTGKITANTIGTIQLFEKEKIIPINSPAVESQSCPDDTWEVISCSVSTAHVNFLQYLHGISSYFSGNGCGARAYNTYASSDLKFKLQTLCWKFSS